MFALIENNQVIQYPYSTEQLRRDNPNISFPAPFTVDTLLSYGVHPVAPTTPPSVPSNQTVTEGPPVLESGEWVQSWDTREATQEEIESRKVSAVSMRQARLALFEADLLDDVDTVIDAFTEPTRSLAKIEWEYAGTVEKNSPLVIILKDYLNLSDTDIDNIFEEAALK
jgi:hypothetical protein